jgi:ribonuclease HI
VEEWQAAQVHTSVKQAPINEQWLPPEQGWCKANVDGAFSMDQLIGGCGLVLRDHHGGFLGGACRCLQSVSDPERAELLACKLALELAKQGGVTKIVLETDCLSAVAKIRNEEKDRSHQGPLVEEIKSLLKSFVAHSVKHVRRSGNGVAHSLAKFSCVNNVCNTWLDVPPEMIVTLLTSECAG